VANSRTNSEHRATTEGTKNRRRKQRVNSGKNRRNGKPGKHDENSAKADTNKRMKVPRTEPSLINPAAITSLGLTSGMLLAPSS
jgi:hypothetical protein